MSPQVYTLLVVEITVWVLEISMDWIGFSFMRVYSVRAI